MAHRRLSETQGDIMESLSPFLSGIVAILLLSCFVKIATALSILRFGIGLPGMGFGAVVLLLSFALSLMAMEPVFQRFGGADAILSGKIPNNAQFYKEVRPFLEHNTDRLVLTRLSNLQGGVQSGMQGVGVAAAAESDAESESENGGKNKTPQPLSLLAASFLISELMRAFQIGLVILLPFFIIDLLVVNISTAVGFTELSPLTLALPLKLLLFIAVDGWLMVSEKLVSGYVF